MLSDIIPSKLRERPLTGRDVDAVFYAGAAATIRKLNESDDAEEMQETAEEIMAESYDFAYAEHRADAARLVAKVGEQQARRKLRVLALNLDLSPEQASIIFGVDLLKFDGHDELRELTLELEKRGVAFNVDVLNR